MRDEKEPINCEKLSKAILHASAKATAMSEEVYPDAEGPFETQTELGCCCALGRCKVMIQPLSIPLVPKGWITEAGWDDGPTFGLTRDEAGGWNIQYFVDVETKKYPQKP